MLQLLREPLVLRAIERDPPKPGGQGVHPVDDERPVVRVDGGHDVLVDLPVGQEAMLERPHPDLVAGLPLWHGPVPVGDGIEDDAEPDKEIVERLEVVAVRAGESLERREKLVRHERDCAIVRRDIRRDIRLTSHICRFDLLMLATLSGVLNCEASEVPIA